MDEIGEFLQSASGFGDFGIKQLERSLIHL